MRSRRHITRAALVAVGLTLAAVSGAAPAHAQTGCNFSDCRPQTPEVAPGESVTTTTTTEVPGGGTVGLPGEAPVPTTTPEAPTGGLPVTGQDLVGMFLLGLAAIGLGAGLSRSRKSP